MTEALSTAQHKSTRTRTPFVWDDRFFIGNWKTPASVYRQSLEDAWLSNKIKKASEQ